MTEFLALYESKGEAFGCHCGAAEHAAEAPSPSTQFESRSESPVADMLNMQLTSLDGTQKWLKLLMTTTGQRLGAGSIIRCSTVVTVDTHQGFMVSCWCNWKTVATEGI